MTGRECQQQALRVRLPHWVDEETYIKFSGPWAHLYSRPTQEAICEPTPQSFLAFEVFDVSGFELYKGPLDEEDKD